MRTKLHTSLAAIAIASASMANAKVSLPDIFSDNMVLQRELPVPVWGTAESGEKVSVSFAAQTHSVTAGADGKWMIKLTPLKTSKDGKTLTISGSNKVTFNNVVVGEVWLCSGQSNMAGKFTKAKGRAIDPAVFKNDLSNFRFNSRLGWKALDQNSQNLVSCVAYYFGYELYKELKIPIGLVQGFNSGTPIQAWMSKDSSEVIRKKLNIPADWNDNTDARNPGVQYEDKIVPLIPYAIRGTIWYQGERNAKAFTGWEYRDLLPHLITTWRDTWAEQAGTKPRKFPFYYVQVPTQESPVDGEWAWLRDGMRRALDTTENTGMAVFYDYGPSLHPENKEPAGQRLALWALANDYGRKDLVHCGPLLKACSIKDSSAILSFHHVGGGLQNKSGEKNLRFFEIAGEDAKYVPAQANIVGDTVIVRSAKVPNPVHVRYLHTKAKPNPDISLINAEGLPASSFMTDDNKPPR